MNFASGVEQWFAADLKQWKERRANARASAQNYIQKCRNATSWNEYEWWARWLNIQIGEHRHYSRLIRERIWNRSTASTANMSIPTAVSNKLTDGSAGHSSEDPREPSPQTSSMLIRPMRDASTLIVSTTAIISTL